MWIVNKLNKEITFRETTFEKISIDWLNLKGKKIKKSTYSLYKYIIDKYLNPQFKTLDLKDLKKTEFNDFVDKLNEDLSPKTSKDILSVLKSILSYAQNKYDIRLKIDSIIIPKQVKEPIKVLSKKEIEKLENFCIKENTLKSLGILICLNTGLRIGEICALRWNNIDLEKKEIRVRRTLERIYDKNKKSKIIIDLPKSVTSIRNIPISNKLYVILKDYKNKYTKNEYFLSRLTI